MLKDENDVAIKRAEANVENETLKIHEALLRDGLTSEAARAFLDAMPDPADMLPVVSVSTILSPKTPAPAGLENESSRTAIEQ